MTSLAEKDLSCSICQDIFNNPVVLSCSHSFCKNCLQRWWHEKQIHTCPLCKELSLLSDPPCNLVLKNLCESFLLEKAQRASAEREDLCSLHSKKLRLFCLDHQEPVCLVCRDSKTHNKHRFRPIDEAVQDHRKELQKHLMPLEEKLKLFEQVKENLDQTAEHIKLQAQRTERQITEQFKKLHKFLQEEEETRISALKEEEKQKSHMMKEKIETLSKQIAAISDAIRVTDEELRAPDISFLQNYKTSVKRVQQHCLQEAPQPDSGALIEEVKHLGNLSFNIWTKMKEMVSYTPVILDPNTAHPNLILSEDLTSVRFGQRQKLPDNPERFDQHTCVMSSEGFDSGTHSWDAEVTNGKYWALGVVKESFQRKGETQVGFWELCQMDGQCVAASPPLPNKKVLVNNLRRVRVQLNCDKGRLSFFDLDTNKHICTIKLPSTGKMFPYIDTKNKSPLKISPVSISATVNHAAPLSAGFWGF